MCRELVGLCRGGQPLWRRRIVARPPIALAPRTSNSRALSFGLIICGLCLVGALTWHNRLLTRAHRDLSLTTADLTQAADDLAAANRAVAAANAELRLKNERLTEKERR